MGQFSVKILQATGSLLSGNQQSALWTDHGYGTMTAAQVIAQFATVNAWGSTVFTFDGGELLILQGVTDLTALEGALFVV